MAHRCVFASVRNTDSASCPRPSKPIACCQSLDPGNGQVAGPLKSKVRQFLPAGSCASSDGADARHVPRSVEVSIARTARKRAQAASLIGGWQSLRPELWKPDNRKAAGQHLGSGEMSISRRSSLPPRSIEAAPREADSPHPSAKCCGLWHSSIIPVLGSAPGPASRSSATDAPFPSLTGLSGPQ